MTATLMIILMLVLAYLCGSLSSAIVICRLFHLPDPRTQGSGNPGTTNVLRIGGKRLAIIVLAGDLVKGVIPVVVARFLVPADLLGWVALAAILGHLYPVFFQFKGGKGVATAAGVLLALAWPLGVAAIVTWVLVAGLSRYSSLAALTTAVLVPVYGFWLMGAHSLPPLLSMTLLILWRHRKNIQRLVTGNEPKIGRSA